MREYADEPGEDAPSVIDVTVKWRNGEPKTYPNMHAGLSGIENGVLTLYAADRTQTDVFIPGLDSGEVVEITLTAVALPHHGGSGPLPRLPVPRRAAAIPLRAASGEDGDGVPHVFVPAVVR